MLMMSTKPLNDKKTENKDDFCFNVQVDAWKKKGAGASG
jgi:hypothetical protein